jgi:hypothetical protein
MQTIRLIGEIQAAAIPALRVAFTIALLVLAGAGLFIYHKRHQFFDRDPNVDNDVPVVRHNREEEIILVWTGMTLVLLFILYQVWSAGAK